MVASTQAMQPASVPFGSDLNSLAAVGGAAPSLRTRRRSSIVAVPSGSFGIEAWSERPTQLCSPYTIANIKSGNSNNWIGRPSSSLFMLLNQSSPFNAHSSRVALPTRRAMSLSTASGPACLGSSLPRAADPCSQATTSASAQVYARLYDTLVDRWSERAKVIEANAPESKVAEWLQHVQSQASPTAGAGSSRGLKRSIDESISTEAATNTSPDTSPRSKRPKLGMQARVEENVNLRTIEEEEEVDTLPPRGEWTRRSSSAPPVLPSPTSTHHTLPICNEEEDSVASSSEEPNTTLRTRRAESPAVIFRRPSIANANASCRSPSTTTPLSRPQVQRSQSNPRRSEALLGVLKSFEKVLETRAQGWRMLANERVKIERRSSAPGAL